MIMAKKNRLALLVGAITILISSMLSAETVILRNHEVFKGKIKAQDAKKLSLNTKEGQNLEFSKQEILKVVYRDIEDEVEIQKIIHEEEQKLKPEERVTPVKKEKTSEGSWFSRFKFKEKENKWSIVWRSALVPGWGQWKAERPWLAAGTFITFIGAAAVFNSQYKAYSEQEKTYQNVTLLISLPTTNIGSTQTEKLLIGAIISNGYYSDFASTTNQANQTLQIIGLIYGAQLIHSYFIGRDYYLKKENSGGAQGAFFLPQEGWNINSFARSSGVGQKEQAYELYYRINF